MPLTPTITISGKVMGKTRPTFTDWQLPLPSTCLTSGLTLKDLLSQIVLAEVAADTARHKQRQLLQVLSPQQIELGLTQGKVNLGGHEPVPEVDLQAALGVALEAFTDGLYYVFVDDQQIETLNTPVPLTANSQLLFLRLVALVGG
jgi:hypothetical protein